MRKSVSMLLAGALVCFSVTVCADTVLQDFETGTDGTNLVGNWRPGYSGTSNGQEPTSEIAIYSTEQIKSGTLSAKIEWLWDWDNVGDPAPAIGTGAIRIQPAAAGYILGSNANVDRTAEPYISMAVYADGTDNDKLQIYMGEGTYGGSPYEAFVDEWTLSYTGWNVVERNVLTDTCVGWVNGDGVLPAVCSHSGIFFRQNGAASDMTTVDYFLDDLQFTAASVKTLDPDSSVGDWSVY